jgi:hypothetical protein
MKKERLHKLSLDRAYLINLRMLRKDYFTERQAVAVNDKIAEIDVEWMKLCRPKKQK